ncbi:hypothetical protein LGAA44_10021 [Leuconostoc gasicomitatum]|nr:hypothetical protein LGAA44_10021 [Leuconostoc gasicomitatum]
MKNIYLKSIVCRNHASFNGDVLPNSNGYNVRLIDGNAKGQ